MHLATRVCPQCSRLMVEKEPTVILLSYPAQYDRIWWCGCGYQVDGGRVVERDEEDLAKEKWEWLNREKAS